jgi:hypothetical protein
VPVDRSGAFSIEVPIGAAVVVARADGYASVQREVAVRAGHTNPALNFSLPRAGSVSGRVVDPSGAPVAGARVWVQYRGEAQTWRLAEEIGGEPADALGNFTIPIVAQGRPFVLHAESDKWLPSSSQNMMIRTPDLQGVLLLLSSRGSSVAGRILDSSGRPVAGADVQLRAIRANSGSPGPDSIAFSRSMNRHAISQADGSYSCEGIPAGQVVVTARQQNQRAAAEAATVSGTLTSLDLSLQ